MKNSFKGKHLVNFKSTFIYPDNGTVRFQIQLDKMGQVCAINQTTAQIIKDDETKKRHVRVLIGDRPQKLYEVIKGRPFALAIPWIDDFIENYSEIDS